MEQPLNRPNRLWPLVLLLLCGALFILQRSLSTQQKAVALLEEQPHPMDATDAAREKSTSATQELSLVDAILSIVQAYYVDAERLTYRQMLEGALLSLEDTFPDLKVEKNETLFRLTADKVVASFDVESHDNYELFVEKVTQLVQFCRDAELGETLPATVPADEREPSHIVLNAFLAGLDAHSALLSEQSYRELRQGTDGAFGGLGVLVSVRDHLLTVVKPMPRSPASRAGVLRQDRILAIDGNRTFGRRLDQLVDHMRGSPGSLVHLLLLREGLTSPLELVLRREVIQVDSVEARTIALGDSNLLHLTVESFSSRTSREILSAIKEAKEKGPLAGIILDLRSNPGGLLDQAVQVSDLFLESGVIVSTKGRREEVERAGKGYDEVHYPMVVLINNDSASASEIVAGALQDHGRAIVIGQPSFGKGSVQTIFELPRGQALKLTIARYYTPSHRSIQNIGIKPDVWLQPVAQERRNLNLLGAARYHSEDSLRNHLAGSTTGPFAERTSQQKGYYLDPALLNGATEREKDVDLDVAKLILSAVMETYGPRLPKEASRAGHWLALAAPRLNRFLSDSNKSVETFLRSEHAVEWLASSKPSVMAADSMREAQQKDFAFTVKGQNVLETGGFYFLEYEVRNLTDVSKDRMSVFVQGVNVPIETQELILGRLKPKQLVKGSLKIPVPSIADRSLAALRVGLAQDASPILSYDRLQRLKVTSPDRPKFVLTSGLKDAFQGKVSGILEPGEKAFLQIHLHNAAKIDAKNLTIKFHNLTGKQLSINMGEIALPELAAETDIDLEVPVTASTYLESEQLALGVEIRSSDLIDEFLELIDIPTRITQTASRQGKFTH